MDREQTMKIMNLIALEFGGRFELSAERLTLWAQMLEKVDYRAAQEAARRILSEPHQWPPQVGEVLQESKMVANEWAIAQRREFEREFEEKENLKRKKEKPLCELSPEEAEAGRQRGLSILRDCIAKMEAKKAGVK